MKKLAVMLCLTALATGVYAQGLINFFNNATTLVSDNGVATSGPVGAYYFGLFIAPEGTSDPMAFAFSGLYGTNQASAGRFTGGANQGMPNFPAGQTRAILVRGWSADLGHDWNPEWLQMVFPGATPTSVYGTSAIAPTFIAGGFDGTGTIPTLVAFGGTTGIQGGLSLELVPEPTSLALAGLGAAALLIFRRRK